MVLSSVIIILREVIEAALLFSILIALSKQMELKPQWLVWAVITGICGAFIYGLNINSISDWFEGVGQEVSNALMQLFIYFMLIFYMLMLTYYEVTKKFSSVLFSLSMMMIISLAITREGSEIILYFFSVTHNTIYFSAVLIGMIIGASIGTSLGFLFYYLLVSIKYTYSINIGLILLLLVSAGMVSQASLLLIQADWLPAQLPLWDSSVLLSEKSVTGQLLYALIGYESTPTAIQASLYLFAFILPIILIISFKYYLNLKKI